MSSSKKKKTASLINSLGKEKVDKVGDGVLSEEFINEFNAYTNLLNTRGDKILNRITNVIKFVYESFGQMDSLVGWNFAPAADDNHKDSPSCDDPDYGCECYCACHDYSSVQEFNESEEDDCVCDENDCECGLFAVKNKSSFNKEVTIQDLITALKEDSFKIYIFCTDNVYKANMISFIKTKKVNWNNGKEVYIPVNWLFSNFEKEFLDGKAKADKLIKKPVNDIKVTVRR